MAEFTVKCPVIVCTQTAYETKSRGNKRVKETNCEWPLESGIGTVTDMSEITTENKVYSHHPQCATKDFITDEVLYKVFKKQ